MEQTAFAELFGVTRWAVGYWERGRSRLGLETIVRLEALSGFPLAVLLGWELEKGELPEWPLEVGRWWRRRRVCRHGWIGFRDIGAAGSEVTK